MVWIIPWLQALAGMAWLAVLVQRLPGAWRIVRGRAHIADYYALPLPLTAAIQTGFSFRWLAWPRAIGAMEGAELLFWAGLYVGSAVSAAMFFALFFKRPVGSWV